MSQVYEFVRQGKAAIGEQFYAADFSRKGLGSVDSLLAAGTIRIVRSRRTVKPEAAKQVVAKAEGSIPAVERAPDVTQ